MVKCTSCQESISPSEIPEAPSVAVNPGLIYQSQLETEIPNIFFILIYIFHRGWRMSMGARPPFPEPQLVPRHCGFVDARWRFPRERRHQMVRTRLVVIVLGHHP